MKFSVNRLKEPSTWAAIAVLATVFGLDPEKANQFATAGAALAAMIAMVMPAKGN
ncbi:hypothetical protein [Asticcacaulis sp.]|uniref:hypothetical protein n=1 Tax=Asticcacaulis sp. TaxID=1872648 RepID=UPI002B7213B4|nr:hypothetical protein [Asticcacaulis sp.]HTM83284.1 hypothetical protein [Asticcacaulis sp.]